MNTEITSTTNSAQMSVENRRKRLDDRKSANLQWILLPVLICALTLALQVSLATGTEEPYVPVPHENLIRVTSPAYGADIQGDTRIEIVAPKFTKLSAKCWKQGDGSGADSVVGEVALDGQGKGSFVFPANAYPHGPVTVRISGENGDLKDICCLQLYNKGGVLWNEGLPREMPPAAQGMKQVFADDFKSPLSIGTDAKAVYYDHKPPNGWQDFSKIRFTSFDKPNNPFSQVDSYLRIRADEGKKSAGLISSVKNDGSGIMAQAPCYFECRFLGPNAIGAWPAFWLLSNNLKESAAQPGQKVPCDELDIIEAYGGEGPRTPNAHDKYSIAPHAWNQGEAGKAAEDKAYQDVHNPIQMGKFGIPSTWYDTFHTYGCKITGTDTIYYCDNLEVARHKTLEVSKKAPFYFLINLAAGGGWPVDLSRYDGRADMYVDYVRVYSGAGGN